MKKIILRRVTTKPDKKERERNLVISGREMFVNKTPRIDIELRRIGKVK